MIPTYQPTRMQKLFGRNYKWWYLFLFSLRSNTTYRFSDLFFLFGTIVWTGGNLIVWYANINNGSELYSFNFIFTYFILGAIINQLFENNFQGIISYDIFGGGINNKMLFTSNLWLQYFFTFFGRNLFWKSIEVAVTVIILIFGWQFILAPSSLGLLGIFALIQIINFLQSSLLSILIGSTTFFFTNDDGFMNFISQLKIVSSGRIFPLDILSVTKFLSFSPFAIFYFHAFQVYFGRYTFNDSLIVLMAGIVWCVVLYFVTKLVFRLGLKKHEAVGL